MEFRLAEALDILSRTPKVLDGLIRGIPRSWYMTNEGPDSWNAFDVIGHLIHGDETDWVRRARIILEHGESQPFEPFDRFAQFERFEGWALDALLDRFAEVRRVNLETVRAWSLTEAQLGLTGLHPEFGRVSLRQLLATWVVHDLSHLAQIARVMAKGYGGEVGPWRSYLSVLTR